MDYKNKVVMDNLLLTATQQGVDAAEIVSTGIDYLYKISMVVIAIVNAILLFRRNKKTDETSAEAKEKDRRISLLKTLILDYNLHYFYEIFDEIERELLKLKVQGCDKNALEQNLQKSFNLLFEKFINFISAIDSSLYDSLKKSCDHCRDKLVENIADEGINLYVEEKYRENIKSVVEADKKEMLSLLFEFKG